MPIGNEKQTNYLLLGQAYHDYTIIGDELWKRFNVKDKSKQEWYYSGIAERLDKVKDTNAFKEYIELLFEVFGWKMLIK